MEFLVYVIIKIVMWPFNRKKNQGQDRLASSKSNRSGFDPIIDPQSPISPLSPLNIQERGDHHKQPDHHHHQHHHDFGGHHHDSGAFDNDSSSFDFDSSSSSD